MGQHHSSSSLFFLTVFALGCSSVHPSSGRGVQRSVTTDSIAFEVTEVTRVAFDVTPDGRSLIIDLLGQLWRVPGSGGDAVAITNAARDTAEDIDPAVSRDGHTIVFQSDRPDGRGLWLMTDDGAPRLLTTRYVGFFSHMAAAWAPDGRHLAYAIGDSLSVLDVMRGGETVVRIDSLPGGSPLPMHSVVPVGVGAPDALA